jgi:predicted nucleic acid-binding protein
MGSEPGLKTAPIVLLDANLLYPFHLRNLLVQLGVNQLIDVRWTDRIHDEWIDNLVASGKVNRARLNRTRDIMKRVLPNATVSNYENRISNLTLPDPDDRHVLAAAIEAGASILLTFNLRDFPTEAMAPFAIAAREPDGFLCEIHDEDPEAAVAAAEAACENLSISAPTMLEFVDFLERQRLMNFAKRLRAAQG